jgi:hypothetical protein
LISKSSIDNLMCWRQEVSSRLEKIRADESKFSEICKASTSAVREARFKGQAVTWEDHAVILEMLDTIVVGIGRMMCLRSADLELMLDKLDKLAEAELPPERFWEWPESRNEVEH